MADQQREHYQDGVLIGRHPFENMCPLCGFGSRRFADNDLADTPDGSRYWDYAADIHYVKADGQWVLDEILNRHETPHFQYHSGVEVVSTSEYHEMRLQRPVMPQGDTWACCVCGDVVAVPWFNRDDPDRTLPARVTAAYRAHLEDES